MMKDAASIRPRGTLAAVSPITKSRLESRPFQHKFIVFPTIYRLTNLVERCVRLHEGVGVGASDVDADKLPRQDVAGAVKSPNVRVSRRGERSVGALRTDNVAEPDSTCERVP